MRIGIFLDDERFPEDVTWVEYYEVEQWIVVRTYIDFCEVVDNLENFEKVLFSFDHDLQDFNYEDGEKTGLSCIKYLAQKVVDAEEDVPVCFFHSKNPCGVKNMEAVYTSLCNFMQNYK